MDLHAEEILGLNDQIFKNGRGTYGIGNGGYDASHKLLRQTWHQTQAKLIGRNRINEIIQASSRQVCDTLREEGVIETGIDPRDIFMNGTLNVVSGFALGIIYDYNDPEFIRLAYLVKTFFNNIQFQMLSKLLTAITPTWLLKQKLFRKLRHFVWDNFLQVINIQRLLIIMCFYPHVHARAPEIMSRENTDN